MALYHAIPNDWIFDTKNIMHSFSLYDVFLMAANVHFQRWCKRANLNAFFSIFISSLWHLIYDVRCDWITYCYSFKSNLCYQAKSVHWIFETRYMFSIIVLSRFIEQTIFGNSKRFWNYFDTVQLKTNYVTCNDKDILFRP